MKNKIIRLFALPALLAHLISFTQIAYGQGTTAFTYQGRLNTASGPATGSYDMTFAVYDAALGGNQIAGPITNSAVAVSNGLFTVTLDFGPGVFTGTNYWVQMTVSTNGAGNFATLAPRQQLTPAPYAISLVSPQATALCPPGSIMAYMGTNAPDGWLMCDGTSYPTNRYPALFAVLGSSCGASGSTFNVPDCRGVFLRGVNGTRSDAFADPDDNTSSRPNVFTGGNSGNEVGSYQADQIAAHNHTEGTFEGNGQPRDIYGSVSFGSQLWGDWQYSAMGNTHALTSTVGGNETRPKNIYVNYIIKY